MESIPDGLNEASATRCGSLPPLGFSQLAGPLAAVLRSAQEQGVDRRPSSRYREPAPEFAALAGDIRQRTDWTLQWWLMFLLALIALW